MATRRQREPPFWTYYVTNKRPITVHLEMIKILRESGYWFEVKKVHQADLLIGGHSGKGILGKLIPEVKQDYSKNESKRNKALQQLKSVDTACQDLQKNTKDEIATKVLINYFPGASLLCDKAKQVRTLRAYCKRKKIPIDQIMPRSFVVSPGHWDSEEFEFLKEFRARENIHLPSVPIYPQSVHKVLASLWSGSRHLPGPKDTAAAAAKEGDVLVPSYVMKKLWRVGDKTAHGGKVVKINPNGSLVVRYRNGERATIRHPGLVRECDDVQRNVWILKPSNGQCGSNIVITNRMSKIQSVLKRASVKGDVVVVQKYLEKPMILKPSNRKFDMRTWVLVTSKFEVCVYHKGVLRTTCEPFRLTGSRILDNDFVHLSNHCIQAKHSRFGEWEDSNEMMWSAFDEYLREHESISFYKHLFPKMCAIIVLTLRAVEKQLSDPKNQYASFQLFGYDFLITQDKKVQLLEVNSSPAIAERLLDEMTQAIVHMAIHPMFPCPTTAPPVSSKPKEFSALVGQQWQHGWQVIYDSSANFEK